MPASDVDPDLLKRGGIRFEVSGDRATITLDRPDVLNAQVPSTWKALAQIGQGLTPDVRVVVVRGSGRAFSAGLDRTMFDPAQSDEPGLARLATAPAAEGSALIDSFQQGFIWLTDPSRVTIAVVHGHAIGAGFQLALACDLRVATPEARFTMAETSLGLVPDLAGTLPLVRAVGYSRAVDICLTGRRVDAEEALRIGLVNRVAAADELESTVDELVAALLKPLPGATRETLALLAKAAGNPTLDEQREAERTAQLRRLAEMAKMLGA